MKSHYSPNRLTTYVFAKSSVRLRIPKNAARPDPLEKSPLMCGAGYRPRVTPGAMQTSAPGTVPKCLAVTLITKEINLL